MLPVQISSPNQHLNRHPSFCSLEEESSACHQSLTITRGRVPVPSDNEVFDHHHCRSLDISDSEEEMSPLTSTALQVVADQRQHVLSPLGELIEHVNHAFFHSLGENDGDGSDSHEKINVINNNEDVDIGIDDYGGSEGEGLRDGSSENHDSDGESISEVTATDQQSNLITFKDEVDVDIDIMVALGKLLSSALLLSVIFK